MTYGRKGPRRPAREHRDAQDAERFAASLARRAEAAKGLERDLLTEVPLLYGSPSNGDPGVTLARLHRDDLRRRHGYPAAPKTREAEVRLPYERLVIALVIIVNLLFFLL
ncbi:MAG: hypothetical protein A4S12_00825 [Proteobacteria bacterium SG_bin5]|nr:MAG: hypothetical protein A4S12_00825 [Proteobacteria bacterium SG_bin5]